MAKKKVEKTVYLVRHGESEDNIAPVFQSVTSPLTELGLEQAKSLAQRISKLPFDALIASPTKRTAQTAAMIAELTSKHIVYSDLFIESKKPAFVDGKPYTDLQADGLWRRWEESLYLPDLRVEDGENFTELITRADKSLDFLKQHDRESLVVVTHSHFLRTILARILLQNTLTEASLGQFHKNSTTENTGITVVQLYKGQWQFWIYNDHSHLG